MYIDLPKQDLTVANDKLQVATDKRARLEAQMLAALAANDKGAVIASIDLLENLYYERPCVWARAIGC